ncbi:MAG TPA: hypothetical protein VGJ20_00300 [Xanthobacteraceae bacterium]|jgi:hypothetical protein
MYLKDYQEAMAQAQANANLNGKPWYVFRDELGRYRAEATKPQTSCQEVSPNPESSALTALDNLWEGGSFDAPVQPANTRIDAKVKRKVRAKRVTNRSKRKGKLPSGPTT